MPLDETSELRLAADIGGTFTDVIGVNLETGEQRIGKVASTPPTLTEPRALTEAQWRGRWGTSHERQWQGRLQPPACSVLAAG